LFRGTSHLTIAAVVEQNVQPVLHHAHTLAHVMVCTYLASGPP
jgi:hypothetical protein